MRGECEMSLLGVQTFLFRLKNDKQLQSQFETARDEAFSNFSLSDEEKRALLEGDLETLYRIGVHPLLLAPFSRYAKIPRLTYRVRLAPFKGTRRFVSY
jgi:aromatic-ring opening dioxygenase LigAB LigA subunit